MRAGAERVTRHWPDQLRQRVAAQVVGLTNDNEAPNRRVALSQ